MVSTPTRNCRAYSSPPPGSPPLRPCPVSAASHVMSRSAGWWSSSARCSRSSARRPSWFRGTPTRSWPARRPRTTRACRSEHPRAHRARSRGVVRDEDRGRYGVDEGADQLQPGLGQVISGFERADRGDVVRGPKLAQVAAALHGALAPPGALPDQPADTWQRLLVDVGVLGVGVAVPGQHQVQAQLVVVEQGAAPGSATPDRRPHRARRAVRTGRCRRGQPSR